MSTYYQFRCPDCGEQGGFFSRQMWGWGNCDLFETFKFMVAHAHCGDLQILNEHDDRYADDAEELKWLERLDGDPDLRDEVWPHADEWQQVAKGWEEAHTLWRTDFERRLRRDRKQAERESDPAPTLPGCTCPDDPDNCPASAGTGADIGLHRTKADE